MTAVVGNVAADHPATPCLVYRGPLNANGYGYPRLVAGRRNGVLLHRWVSEQVDGPLAPGEVVRHWCDNPPCFRYDHLLRGTQRINLLECVAKGRHRYGYQPGERNGSAKLGAEQVEAIRRACGQGQPQRQVARLFGVSQSQVSNIVRRAKWRHLS